MTGSMVDLVGNWKVGVISEHTKGTVVGDWTQFVSGLRGQAK